MCHCEHRVKIHVKIYEHSSRILLEFGMYYPCLSLVIVKSFAYLKLIFFMNSN
jgi:hypothetical protein